jgi:hypothetical protein
MAECDNLKKITIHTDGACDGNLGPGGCAALLRYGTQAALSSGHSSRSCQLPPPPEALFAACHQSPGLLSGGSSLNNRLPNEASSWDPHLGSGHSQSARLRPFAHRGFYSVNVPTAAPGSSGLTHAHA